MIIDSSALIAILRNEAEAPELAKQIGQANHCFFSAANFVEISAVVMRSSDAQGLDYLD